MELVTEKVVIPVLEIENWILVCTFDDKSDEVPEYSETLDTLSEHEDEDDDHTDEDALSGVGYWRHVLGVSPEESDVVTKIVCDFLVDDSEWW